MAKKNNQFNLPYTGQEVQQAVANGLIAVTTDPEQTFDAETQQMLRDKLGMDNQRVEAVQQFDWAQNDPEAPSYIRNRTHYYAPPEFDISWDGEIGDRFAVDAEQFGVAGLCLVKVDDRVFSVEQMRGSVLENTNGKDIYDIYHVEACNCDAYALPDATASAVVRPLSYMILISCAGQSVCRAGHFQTELILRCQWTMGFM
mgnify:CR=1 FL=1